MKHFSPNNGTSQNTRNHLGHLPTKRLLQSVKNATVALTLSYGSTQADDLTLPVGVSIIHANTEQGNLIRQNAKMCHELGEVENGNKVLFVMTDAPQTITVRAGEEFPVYYYGDQERFFARLNPQNIPEISIDLNHWEQCSDENRIPVFRENPEILSDVNSQIEVLADLNTSEQTLVNNLSQEIVHLEQLGESLDASNAELNQLDIQKDEVFSELDQGLSIQQVLEINMIPEEQLREDIHPVVSSATMDDSHKNTETQEALDVYHQNITNPAQLSPTESGINTIPELADTHLTISYLTQELTRIQGSINTVNAQITTKENDINNTQNTIQSLQNTINQLTAQITQYANNYTYWRDEYNRIIALITNYNAEVTAQSANYSNSRGVLMNAGRNDIPSDISAYNLSTLLTNLKNTILSEYNSVPYTQNTGPVGTDYNLPDETSAVRDYLGSQYYYVVDFPSYGKSWPATLRLYVKLLGATSFTQLNSYPVQNRNHSINMFNGTAKPQAEKLAQYKYVDDVLERYYELYQAAKNSAEQQYGPRDTAKSNRDTAKSQLDIAYALNDQKQAEMGNLQSQQNLLTQQRTDLENLKSIKTNLQTLYNQVQVILNNLKNHIVTHEEVSGEIQNLLTQYGILEEQIADLIEVIESKIVVTNAQVRKVEGITTTLTSTTTQIATERSELIDLFERNFLVKTRDGINNMSLTYAQIEEYFSYAYRTSMGPTSEGILQSRAIVEYLDNGTKEDLYPAQLSYEYKINGKVYFTPRVVINNLEHKGVMAELSKIALSELESCFGEIAKGSDLNDGMKKMWDMIRLKSLATGSSADENAYIIEYENLKKKTIEDIVLSGGSQAFFDHLLLHEPSFRQRINDSINTIAQSQGVENETNEYRELEKIFIHILARGFGESLAETGFSGLTNYTDYRLFAESHIAIMTNNFSANEMIIDINDNWDIDDHGNKYKYGLCSLNSGNYPKYIWMSYSPDGISVQTVGPVVVNNLGELSQQKERWRRNLLQSKVSHTNYSGGAYDIFQGWSDEGERVWWGQYSIRSGGGLKSTRFYTWDMRNTLETDMRVIIKNSQDISYFRTQSQAVNNIIGSQDMILNWGNMLPKVFPIQNHDATGVLLSHVKIFEKEIGVFDKDTVVEITWGAGNIKLNPVFIGLSFQDPTSQQNTVYIEGYPFTLAELGNFFVGFNASQAWIPEVVCRYKALQVQKNVYKGQYPLLNSTQLNELAELSEEEDGFMYSAGYRYDFIRNYASKDGKIPIGIDGAEINAPTLGTILLEAKQKSIEVYNLHYSRIIELQNLGK